MSFARGDGDGELKDVVIEKQSTGDLSHGLALRSQRIASLQDGNAHFRA